MTFGSHPSYGLDLAYHITEDLFVRAEAGRSTGGLTSFETLSGGLRLLTEGERKFTYYDLGLGYNFLPGEAFLRPQPRHDELLLRRRRGGRHPVRR